MKTVVKISTVDPNKCVGCGFCLTRCMFDAIRLGEDHKARIIDEKCMNCNGCLEICPHSAVGIKMLDEPRVIKINVDDVDPKEIDALCQKVHRDPDRIICVCTHTTAREVAAAIIKGARTVKEVAEASGATCSSRIHCTMPVLEMLEAYGCVQKPTDNNNIVFFPCEVRLDNLPEEVLDKYPQFYLREDLAELEKNEIPFLPEMF